MAQLLIDRGADPSEEDESGEKPITKLAKALEKHVHNQVQVRILREILGSGLTLSIGSVFVCNHQLLTNALCVHQS